jgi:hypothetical protein
MVLYDDLYVWLVPYGHICSRLAYKDLKTIAPKVSCAEKKAHVA